MLENAIAFSLQPRAEGALDTCLQPQREWFEWYSRAGKGLNQIAPDEEVSVFLMLRVRGANSGTWAVLARCWLYLTSGVHRVCPVVPTSFTELLSIWVSWGGQWDA